MDKIRYATSFLQFLTRTQYYVIYTILYQDANKINNIITYTILCVDGISHHTFEHL